MKDSQRYLENRWCEHGAWCWVCWEWVCRWWQHRCHLIDVGHVEDIEDDHVEDVALLWALTRAEQPSHHDSWAWAPGKLWTQNRWDSTLVLWSWHNQAEGRCQWGIWASEYWSWEDVCGTMTEIQFQNGQTSIDVVEDEIKRWKRKTGFRWKSWTLAWNYEAMLDIVQVMIWCIAYIEEG